MKVGQILVGTLGGFFLGVTGMMCIALYAPFVERDRVLAAGLSFIPFWVGGLFLAGLSRSTVMACVRVGGCLLLLAGIAVAGLMMGRG